MSTLPSHKVVQCPQCSAAFRRAIVWFDGKELFAHRGCLCADCEATRAAAVAAVNARQRHLEQWAARVPPDYRKAKREAVPAPLLPALNWTPTEDTPRLGVWGTAGAGKSMAVALVVRDLGLPFRWTNGFAARATYNAAVSMEGEPRKKAAADWTRFIECPLLVIDDVDKGNFTEAWASALFDLLESRNGHCRPTIWTSNHGPGQLAKKIAKCGDAEMADAIERRLCGGALILFHQPATTSTTD